MLYIYIYICIHIYIYVFGGDEHPYMPPFPSSIGLYPIVSHYIPYSLYGQFPLYSRYTPLYSIIHPLLSAPWSQDEMCCLVIHAIVEVLIVCI